MPHNPSAYHFMRVNWSVVRSFPRGRFIAADLPQIDPRTKSGFLIRMKNLGLIRKVGLRRTPHRGDCCRIWETTRLFWKIAEELSRREQA